mmetsp:Transcript_28868/g.60780  ORF Transcript_28868/g.60780 Transcript_28868/m.60780 type:complete len:107 (-) Transcript_28868:186-506(-)
MECFVLFGDGTIFSMCSPRHHKNKKLGKSASVAPLKLMKTRSRMNMLLEGVRNEILKDFAVRTYQLGSPIICEIKGATLIITVNMFVSGFKKRKKRDECWRPSHLI